MGAPTFTSACCPMPDCPFWFAIWYSFTVPDQSAVAKVVEGVTGANLMHS